MRRRARGFASLCHKFHCGRPDCKLKQPWLSHLGCVQLRMGGTNSSGGGKKGERQHREGCCCLGQQSRPGCMQRRGPCPCCLAACRPGWLQAMACAASSIAGRQSSSEQALQRAHVPYTVRNTPACRVQQDRGRVMQKVVQQQQQRFGGVIHSAHSTGGRGRPRASWQRVFATSFTHAAARSRPCSHRHSRTSHRRQQGTGQQCCCCPEGHDS